MDNSVLFQLTQLRQASDEAIRDRLVELSNNKITNKSSEVKEAYSEIKQLQQKLKLQEENQNKLIRGLRLEMQSKDQEISDLKEQVQEWHQAANQYKTELNSAKKSVSDLVAQREQTAKKHSQELSDLNLKHEQELYIIKKLQK